MFNTIHKSLSTVNNLHIRKLIATHKWFQLLFIRFLKHFPLSIVKYAQFGKPWRHLEKKLGIHNSVSTLLNLSNTVPRVMAETQALQITAFSLMSAGILLVRNVRGMWVKTCTTSPPASCFLFYLKVIVV